MVVKAGKKKMNRHGRTVDSPQSLTDILAEAIRLHQSGNLAEAESLYRQILLNDPDHADALHLLGVTAYQRGNNKQAVENIERAITINPSVSFYHNNLGNAFMSLNENDKALQCFKEALRLKPDNVEACNNLGNTLRKQGKNKEALVQYIKAVEMDPDYVAAINNLANLLKGDEAIMHYRRAIRLQPDLAEAYYNLGNALKESDETEEAVEQYRKAISINPGFADAYNNLANVLKRQKEYVEAAEHYHKAISINPDFTEAYTNLGDTYREEGRFDEALKECRKAISLNPAFEEAYVNLGNIFLDRGNFRQAVEQYNRAIDLNPDLADAHYNKGLVLLLKGEFEEGWKEYEWRFQSREISRDIGYTNNEITVWDGSPLNGKTILIISEQGMGDHIQFVRYIPLVKKLGGRVVFESRRELMRLFEGYEGIDLLLEESKSSESDINPDTCVQLLSLPRIFGATLDTIFADVPYLKADPETTDKWKSRFNHELFNVGLVWSGSTAHRNDCNRSCSLADFVPLADIPGVALFSLQKGGISENGAGMRIKDIGKDLDDFYDTAAAIENMDLVISVDTSVAHLAGALGRPVWTLLPFVPDWRWMLKREDTPWYPTMRLLRQTVPGDWASVMKRVAAELKNLTFERSAK
ncbi:MAG TPA: tetratricopeptide repeat protein [Nitrospirae bacterium]|nr:TPR repeat-containing protein YrrB [bacterium BMS3Abin06]HDH11417.1 tetratricopeptide repeat protein [Nitrospirota bacterium]HDZ01429.1 tetratricopeptide repeat protein [Nitrospirota bacterium]